MKVIGIPEGRGCEKSKFFKEKYEARLEFPEQWGGVQTNFFLGGEGVHGYFVEKHIPYLRTVN